MAPVLAPRRYRPMLEKLEERLPPGSVLDWLLFPLLAQALLPSTSHAFATLGTERSTATFDRQDVPSSRDLRLLGNRESEPVHRPEVRIATQPPAQIMPVEPIAPVFTLIGENTLGQLTEAANRIAASPRDSHQEPHRAVMGDASHHDMPRGGHAPISNPAFVVPHAADITGVVGLGGDGGILSGPGVDQELVPPGSDWKYLDDGSNQGTAWRGLTFDDSGWASGYAQLGYGDGDEVTEVGFGPDPDNKYITTYFRHTFSVDDPSVFPTLQTWLLRDDGAVVYLNGTEIYRSNMPIGTINYLTLASTAIGGDDESAWHHSALPSDGVLFAGANVLAVEVHQATVNSSDISFDFDLIGAVVVRFAVIGDYGESGPAERSVADMVHSWYPDFVITTGDNNYPTGEASTIVQNIGDYYCTFIHNPDAPANQRCDSGLSTNRFYPSPGNHDWASQKSPPLVPYQDYFTLPGNERYYETRWGSVQLFAVDSDASEPDGIRFDSTQGNWLRTQLAASTAPWKLVYMHHPPYSSGSHGSQKTLQWDYQKWGASAVLAGHDHTYERIIRNGFPYFVNGLGGNPYRYEFGPPIQGSAARYNEDWGAMYVEATSWYIYFAFVNVGGTYYDDYVLIQ